MKLGIPDVSRDIAEFRADLRAIRGSLGQLSAIRGLLERLVEIEEAKQ